MLSAIKSIVQEKKSDLKGALRGLTEAIRFRQVTSSCKGKNEHYLKCTCRISFGTFNGRWIQVNASQASWD